MGKIKRSYVVEQSLQTRWGGGQIVKISSTHFATINNLEVYIIDSTSGNTAYKLEPNDESDDRVVDVAVDTLLRFAITSHESMLLKFWTNSNDKWTVYKQWKFPGNNAPSLIIDPTARGFAAITTNGGCYFYSVQTQKQIGKANIVNGQITSKAYDTTGQLWIGTNLGKLSIVDPKTLKTKTLTDPQTSHTNRVTGIADVGDYIFTASLDEVILVFNREVELQKTVPVQYPIHFMVGDPKNSLSCYCATSDGIKRVWLDDRSHIKKLNTTVATHLVYFETLFSCDENGILATVDLQDGVEPHAIPLSLHSVYDATYDAKTETSSLATSSFHIIVTQKNNTHLLTGHTNIPLCVASMDGLLITGAKDNTARIWSLETFSLLSTLEGHSEAVTAVAFVPGTSNVVTASADHTVKMWRPGDGEEICRSALCNVVAHTKDINAIDVSSNGSMLATASRDKTCKLYKIEGDNLKLMRTLVGHTGALWTVAFSPVDKIVATGSRDNTVKIWNIEDGACLSTFTEFTASILRLRFATSGLQIIAAEGDGIFKALRTKTGAIDFTSPQMHSDSVWALAVSNDGEHVLTGSEDGSMVLWRDNTEQLEAEELQHKAEVSEAEQELQNALRNGEYVKALRIALKLRMPAKLRSIVRMATEKGEGEALVEYFKGVEDVDDYEQWLEYIAKWSTNGRWADDATASLSAILKVKPMKFFVENRKKLAENIDGIIPYLERHMARLEKLHTQTYMIDHILDSTTLE
ncbi:wd-repeat protein, putative [Trichomonas vaginalis G3]|uniref:Wd-repeat protein, putative n=1 Tax=Trichomonas vaginalis (strain ATCC PRA-98 / G3) TaxID=412133 RepID=A2FEC1_TRIV3|nr:transducin beta-like protein 3 family [Trichomonas vaginalis G3]EAX96761.1 wd-repeat protein, putative [Trichomonas vaginalis G3]KAI5520159.1 transducin beta-like protein 3 family [Trichomonas vaginalis G3]|eukprot:XP_001309691.1 wd-repeat protein [Trichomonas vaginalis G3]